jgi:hypothetical protein
VWCVCVCVYVCVWWCMCGGVCVCGVLEKILKKASMA